MTTQNAPAGPAVTNEATPGNRRTCQALARKPWTVPEVTP
jgi:hypothetical protein